MKSEEVYQLIKENKLSQDDFILWYQNELDNTWQHALDLIKLFNCECSSLLDK